ncbi:unnamed protein product [Pleuronectes platessa]|uniref:Uncharacterized protein n=1 Tax=Pleuronectes platessa TaxID=8262 RepID=A0A9N7U3Q7_PLEPL|nr:unnamed protein product [Pleuronectes platessa]
MVTTTEGSLYTVMEQGMCKDLESDVSGVVLACLQSIRFIPGYIQTLPWSQKSSSQGQIILLLEDHNRDAFCRFPRLHGKYTSNSVISAQGDNFKGEKAFKYKKAIPPPHTPAPAPGEHVLQQSAL